MMRNQEQTIVNMADKSNMILISYIDDVGYPITKAMLKPREHGSPWIMILFGST